MSRLFETTTLRGIGLRNRLVRSATWEGLADPRGHVTRRLIEMMVELARGRVGLIIASHAHVRTDGRAGIGQLGLYGDGLIPDLAEMTAAVHAAGGLIVAQLAHAGVHADPELSGRPRVAVSAAVPGRDGYGEELSAESIAEIVVAFGQAAARAKDAGFDAVQIHAAHTYLLSQFLSPYFNRRSDRYGGSLGNRVRALMEVYHAVRQAVGPNYPVLLKLNASDYLDGGLTEEDSISVYQTLDGAGVDAIEISGGNLAVARYRPARPGKITPQSEVYYRRVAEALKGKRNCPLILVGGIRSFETAEALVREGVADYIALSRPLVAEPDLIKRWEEGDRRPSQCVSDNRCYGPILAGQGIACVTRREELASDSRE